MARPPNFHTHTYGRITKRRRHPIKNRLRNDVYVERS
jgi:hypothetical protein